MLRTELRNIGIIGAGAMGCLYGALLCHDPENAVTFLDHSAERAEYLRNNGIAVTENGIVKRFAVNAVTAANAPDIDFDWLFVLVKAHQTSEALAGAGKSAVGAGTVVSLQNGLGNGENIAAFVPEERIVLGVSNHNSTKLKDGEIRHPSPDAETFVGTMTGKDPEKAEKTAALFAASGSKVIPLADIYPAIWRKLLVNMAINPLTMLCGKKNGFIAEDPRSRETVSEMLQEGILAARSRGIFLDHDEMLRHIYNVCMLTREGISSMLQDRLDRRVTEIDYINGAVAAIAAAGNIPAPVNTRITAQVHALEKSFI